ncbi:MAG: DUF3500 domain-containing protein [Methylococcales symbiont of Iophon sp. n. MRB-2018]|nr:MAG: DUF3500 domain-containing protein [Methylococcales symbiont of Iophon sp. n. MRB-2018]
MQKFLIVGLFWALSSGALAHQTAAHKHAPLVPIPEYDKSYGVAGGASAYQGAMAFLSVLSEDEKAKIIYAIDAKARAGWSNLPAKMVKRGGLKLGDLSDQQIAVLFNFLSASLSEDGYQTVAETLAAEAVLSMDKKAKRLQWNPKNYWLGFYGTPSSKGQWGWQFGGHHLGINMAIENGVISSLSPTFVGTEPATFEYKGQRYEPVRDMHKAGLDLLHTLSASQQLSAALSEGFRDIITGPGEDGFIPDLQGTRVADFSPEQKTMLLNTIRQWVDIQPDENATLRMVELTAELDDMYFAWYGEKDGTGDNYFRIQGPTLIIEMLSQANNVGASTQGLGHYHTIYRNVTNEYGRQKKSITLTP